MAVFEAEIVGGIAPAIARIDRAAAFADEIAQELRIKLLVAEPGQSPRVARYAARGPLRSWVQVAAIRAACDRKRRPDAAAFPADGGVDLSGIGALAVSRAEVASNFERYGLLDDRVRFLEGWFADTLSTAPISRLALIRLDGDLYQSTWEALDALYPKLSPGGILIVDDYGAFEPCRRAVHAYRDQHHIHEEIITVDWTGVWWRRDR